MHKRTLSDIFTRLYLDFLQSLALDNPSLQDILLDTILGGILTESSHVADIETVLHDMKSTTSLSDLDQARRHGPFQESEIFRFGTPARHHLNASTKQRLLEEVHAILCSITEFFHGDRPDSDEHDKQSSTLAEDIENYKAEKESMQQEIATVSRRLAELITDIAKMREGFDHELEQAISTTLPAYDAACSASIDLLAATIEASLIKLSLNRAHSERAFYNHHSKEHPQQNNNVAHAVEYAYAALKREEKEMKAESHSLDRQLQEYESLLQLVDGGNGGYQQIINDWTRVKQDTDECLKDLRRLGWTGD